MNLASAKPIFLCPQSLELRLIGKCLRPQCNDVAPLRNLNESFLTGDLP